MGCPHNDCDEQNAYLAEQKQAMDEYERRLWDLPGRPPIVSGPT